MGIIPFSQRTARAPRFLIILTISVLFYIFVVDTFIRPPTRAMTFEDYEEAEMGTPDARQRLLSPTTTTAGGNDSTKDTPNVLLVSAFFPLAKSKHSKADYEDWLARFLEPITTDIYMFTTPELADTIQRIRTQRSLNTTTTTTTSSSGGAEGDQPINVNTDRRITVDTTFSSPFDIPPLRGLEAAYAEMNERDPEKWHHSPGLYAVWNAKPYFLDLAVRTMNDRRGSGGGGNGGTPELGRGSGNGSGRGRGRGRGKIYDFAFWNDAGSFRRTHVYADWPSPERVKQVWEDGVRAVREDGEKRVRAGEGMSVRAGKGVGVGREMEEEEELLFFPIFQPPDEQWKDWEEGMGPIRNSVQFSEGSFFGGSPAAISWFARTFYAYHHHFLSLSHFVGIDQDIFNALLILFPSHFFTVWMNDPQAPAHAGITPSPSLLPSSSLERGFLGECGPEWFYYQFFFARREERDGMRGVWIGEGRWRMWGWWEGRRVCRLTRVMSMRGVLERAFGEAWVPPRRGVVVGGV